VLAAGELAGFRGLELMEWAAVVACVSVFALLLAIRRAFGGLPRFAAYLAPAALLGVGALSWALFSGMEIAFFLALWAARYSWTLSSARRRDDARRSVRALGLGTGRRTAATRPEALGTVVVFSLTAAWAHRQRGAHVLLPLIGLVVGPALGVVVATALVNVWLTGEAAAAGAIAKLELYHPYLSFREKLDLWFFFLGYQALRSRSTSSRSRPPAGSSGRSPPWRSTSRRRDASPRSSWEACSAGR
jgi:hypothetical protein